MGLLKSLISTTGKSDRERKVLMGLVDLYIKTGKPVGSNTLREEGFSDLSSATIRNYFAHLEEEGYLLQQHSSGGRIPSNKAFRQYAAEYRENATPSASAPQLHPLNSAETREVSYFLQQAAELFAEQTHSAVFLSAPRFDKDFILSIKIIGIDATRCLCALITDFGEIRTEILYSNIKLTAFSIKRIETYFNWRISGKNKPALSSDEELYAQNLYSELMVRFIVKYANFGEEELYRTGFSRLLIYPEYREAELLANSLSFFENTHGMRLILKDCLTHNRLSFWIGEDLSMAAPETQSNSAVIAIPYYVNHQPVGAIGLLGPVRMPYRTFFGMIQQFSENVSAALTKNLYKFKISLKQSKQNMIDLTQPSLKLITESHKLLLEDKRASPPQSKKEANKPSVNPPSRRKKV